MSYFNMIKLDATASSNDWLKEKLLSGSCIDGQVVWVKNQTKGRGQVDAQWHSQPNNSLTLSVFKRFEGLQISQQWYVSMAVSLAVFYTLKHLKIPEISIKWPNDIMSRSKKCCVILIENTIKGTHLDSAIIGIGINVNENQFKDLPLASSLRLASGNSFDISLVLEVLLLQLKIQLTRLDNQDFEAIFNSYNQDLFRLDTVAVFSTNTKVPFNAILRGVTKSGLLVLENEASQRDTYNLKEIKYHF